MILEQIGEVSAGSIRIENLADTLKEKAIQQARFELDCWHKSLAVRMADKSKNWTKSENNIVFKQKEVIKYYINNFTQSLSEEIKTWGDTNLVNGILKPQIRQLDEEIEQ